LEDKFALLPVILLITARIFVDKKGQKKKTFYYPVFLILLNELILKRNQYLSFIYEDGFYLVAYNFQRKFLTLQFINKTLMGNLNALFKCYYKRKGC
jgi:hypothetical protein